jgi:hypothetical protein
MSRRGHLAIGALLACAALAASTAASAQSSLGRYSGDWRRAGRPVDEDRMFTLKRFAFEARFGPYYPEIDEEFGGAATPYADVFNDNPQFYFGFEIDWLPFRIPFVGVIGPGLGWGYTWASTKAKIAGTNRESGQDTSLWIMPMHLSAVLRADGLMRETGIPIVPYGKLGLGWGLWSAAAGEDTSQIGDTLGRGTSYGIHLALGLMLSLSWMDPRASSSLDESTGLRSIYIFGEWMNANLDGLGGKPQMHVGTSTWVLGIAAQM